MRIGSKAGRLVSMASAEIAEQYARKAVKASGRCRRYIQNQSRANVRAEK
jgi:hypothetical protein